MPQYKEGTVTVAHDSAVIQGQGTLWAANIIPGCLFKKKNENVIYEIGSVDSNTQITLAGNYVGSGEAGTEYQICRDFTPNLDVPEVWAGDQDWPYHLTRGLRQIDTLLAKHNRITTDYGTASTTDATETALLTIPLEDNSVATIEATAVARCGGGAGGNIGKGAGYFLKGTFSRISGEAAALIGSVNQVAQEDVGSWDGTLEVSGASVVLNVTGGATDTISWSGIVEVQHVN